MGRRGASGGLTCALGASSRGCRTARAVGPPRKGRLMGGQRCAKEESLRARLPRWEKLPSPPAPPPPGPPRLGRGPSFGSDSQPALGAPNIADLNVRMPKLPPRGQRGAPGGSASPARLRSQPGGDCGAVTPRYLPAGRVCAPPRSRTSDSSSGKRGGCLDGREGLWRLAPQQL